MTILLPYQMTIKSELLFYSWKPGASVPNRLSEMSRIVLEVLLPSLPQGRIWKLPFCAEFGR